MFEKIEAIEREDSNITLLTMASFTTVVSLALVVTLCTYLHSKYKRLQQNYKAILERNN